MSRGNWLFIPLALTVGAAGGAIATRQVMIRSVNEAQRMPALAVADVPMPQVAPEAPSPAIPMPPPRGYATPPPPDAPSYVQGEPKQIPQALPDETPNPPDMELAREPEFVPPPDYFDLPAPHKNDGTDPPLIKPGQVLQVEILEALPGRPISGERVVRPDGTIGLGYYGDLRVAGLNRLQIKVKLIEHLRKFINDEPLGLVRPSSGNSNQWERVPPVESGRVFVDESANYLPGGPHQAVRPRTTVEGPSPMAMNARITELSNKLNAVIQELKELRAGSRPTAPPRSPFDETPVPVEAPPIPPAEKPGR